jgi:hypothetical protein
MAWLTNQDVSDYGGDLVNFSQRAALDAVAPHLQNLEAQNHELNRRLAREARARLDMRVEQAVPDYRTIDADPRWHQYLLGVDSLSGRQRQTLLNEAIANVDAPRVIAFFRTFLREAGTAGQAWSPSGQARSMPSGQIYTRAQIARLYRQHQQGAYRGREDAWARQEADIIRASAEGRITGGVDVAGK